MTHVSSSTIRIGVGLLAVTAGGFARTAAADVTRCSSGDADLHYNGTVLQEMTGDTGWVPSGSVAQLRITGRIAGETTVAMGLQPAMCWPSGVELTAPGRAGTGLLDFAYGGELHLYGQIHTTVLGQSIDWSGEIPVPLVPTDLMLAKTQAFDPTLLPGSATDHVEGSDTTSPITVLSTNLIGDYIDITGISGGLHVDVTGAMTTSYRTTQLVVGDAAISQVDGHASVEAPADGFAASLELPVAATGTVTYAPALVFSIAFDVKILGIRVVNYTLASVTMPLPQINNDITLAAQGAHLPLPKAAPLAGSRVDFASGSQQSLTIQNLGEAALMLEASSPSPQITVAPTTIAPGQSGILAISAAADAFAGGTVELGLVTNDPGQPTVSITLGRDIGGTTSDPDGSSQAGGCSAGRGTGLPVGLALFALVWRRRRQTASV